MDRVYVYVFRRCSITLVYSAAYVVDDDIYESALPALSGGLDGGLGVEDDMYKSYVYMYV